MELCPGWKYIDSMEKKNYLYVCTEKVNLKDGFSKRNILYLLI